MSLSTRILVPTDVGDGVTVAQEDAAAQAVALGARLHVRHAIADRPLGDDRDARGDNPPRLGHVAVGVVQQARCPVLALTAGAAGPPMRAQILRLPEGRT